MGAARAEFAHGPGREGRPQDRLVVGALRDVDDDARLVARLVVEAPACADKVMAVPCTPGEGLLLSGYHRFPVHASSSLTRLRAVDLSDDYGAEQFEQWRRMLLRTNDLADDTRD